MTAIMHQLKKTLQTFFDEQYRRFVYWIAIFYGAGAGFFYLAPNQWQQPVLWIILALGALALMALPSNAYLKNARILWIVFIAGVLTAQLHQSNNDTVLLTRNLSPKQISGTVYDFEPVRAGWRVYLEEVEFIDYESDKPLPQRLRLTVRQDDYTPSKGQKVETRASLMAPSKPLVKGSFDFQRHAFFDEIGAYGFAIDKMSVLQETTQGALSDLMTQYRSYVSDMIRMHLPRRIQGVALALTTGQKSAILEAEEEMMRRAGLAHLLAISGLHVGLVAALIFYVVRLVLATSMTLALHYPIKKWAAGTTIILITLYAVFVGASFSTTRALIMTILVLLAVMFDRISLTLRTVALAALVLLAMSPHSIVHPGFQMSFAAVIALVTFYQDTRQWWQGIFQSSEWPRRMALYVMGTMVTTIIATIATMPFAIYHFQQVSVLGVFANALVMPLVSFLVMPAILLLLTVAGAGGTVAMLPLTILDFGITAILSVAGWIANFEMAVLPVPAISGWLLFLWVIGVLWLCVVNGWRYRLYGLISIIVAIVGVIMTPPLSIAIPKDGSFVGIRKNDILYISRDREKFTQEIVQRYVGAQEIKLMQDSPEHFRCDDFGCVDLTEGYTIPLTKEALIEDCALGKPILTADQRWRRKYCP